MRFVAWTFVVLSWFLSCRVSSAQSTAQPPQLALAATFDNMLPGAAGFSVTGQCGSWVHILVHVFLEDNPTIPGDQAAPFLAQYPFLARQSGSVPPSTLYDNSDPGSASLAYHPTLFREFAERVLHNALPDEVKGVYQYISGSAGSWQTTDWQANPGLWAESAAGLASARHWRSLLMRHGLPNIPQDMFNVEFMALDAAMRQAATMEDGLTAWNDHVATWINLGILRVSVQALALQSDASLANPASENGDPPGLPDLPTPPKVKISSPVIIDVVSKPPALTFNYPNSDYIAVHATATAQGTVELPMEGIFSPMTLTFQAGNRTFVVGGEASGIIGYATFDLPPAIPAGTVISIQSVTNGVDVMPAIPAAPYLVTVAPAMPLSSN